MAVDLDRGVTIKLLPEGKRVCMYKDTPGVYFDGTGEEVSEDEAQLAGFDTKKLDMERQKNHAFAAARAEIEREFALKEQELMRLMTHVLEGHELQIKKDGKVYRVLDEAGTVVSTRDYERKSDIQEILDQAGGSLGALVSDAEAESPDETEADDGAKT